MTCNEFSDGFDTLVDSYRRFKDFDKQEMLDSVEFNEYEKSFFLTEAQDEMVVNLYNGKNIYGDSFEGTEEMRRYLSSLVKTCECALTTGDDPMETKYSLFYSLPDDIYFIIHERVTIDDDSLEESGNCHNGMTVDVYPVTHDEYNRIKRNPFRGSNYRRVLRLDVGTNKVELVCKWSFKDYTIRYISKPEPIILETLDEDVSIHGKTAKTECALHTALHYPILKRAVQLGLASKGIQIS